MWENLFALSVIMAGMVIAQNPDDIYWDNSLSPAISGVNGDACAMVIYNGKLIVGGVFSVAGGTIANGIAAWNDTTWSSLGSGVTNGAVYALAVYDSKLIAGGGFVSAGGVAVTRVASWDGTNWSSLGSGVTNGVVNALAVYDNKLIAGGLFDSIGGVAASIAAWDGTTWSPLGSDSGGYNGQVRALVTFDNKLIAGGVFDSIGGIDANGIASWDGATWSSLGSGMSGNQVTALAIYDNQLIASGLFDAAGGVAANNIAAWNGTSWSPLGLGIGCSGQFLCPMINALTVYDDHLVASGWFDSAGGAPARAIATWDGSTWMPFDTGFMASTFGIYTVTACAVYGTKLVVGGGNVVAWDGTTWSSLGSATNGDVSDLAVYDNELIAGGSFYSIGGVDADHIASWNGTTWSPLGSEMKVSVFALTTFEDRLLVCGSRDSMGEYAVAHIVAWDGTNWSPFASVSGSYYAFVSAFVDHDNLLIAAGEFDSAGGIAASNIAAWDGTTWLPLGLGIKGEWARVYALAVYDNKLIVGGDFDSVGGVAANNIAMWDGTSWSPLGPGMSVDGILGEVRALAIYDNQLIVGGQFLAAGGVAAKNVVAWDGTSWSPLGLGISMLGYTGLVYALAIYDNQLIVGGWIDSAGGVAANNIAAWDGTSWSPLGSGIKGTPYALTVYDSALIAGGTFTHAGGKVAAYLARWTKGAPTDVDEDALDHLPCSFSLDQNYPNPFNPATTIEYSIPTRSQVTIEVFNILGQRVRTLVNETKAAGTYRAEWNGTDDSESSVSTGMYLYRFQAGDVVRTKKMLLIK